MIIENRKGYYKPSHTESIMQLGYLGITFQQKEAVQIPRSVRRQKHPTA